MKDVVITEIKNLLGYGVDVETIVKTYLSGTMEPEKVLVAVQYILDNYQVKNSQFLEECQNYIQKYQKEELTISEKVQNMLAHGMTPELVINHCLSANMDEQTKNAIVQYVLLNYQVNKNEVDEAIHFMYTNDTLPLIETFESNIINPILDKIALKNSLTEEEAGILIRWISSKTKEGLQIATCQASGRDISWDNLFGACGVGQGISGLICQNLGLEITTNNIADTISDYRHAYLSVEIPIENSIKTYIVDCTYRQFFTLWWLNPKEKSVGINMQEDDNLKNFADHVLKNGYFELTKENWESYQYGSTGIKKNLSYEEIKKILKNNQDELDYEEAELEEWGVSVRR